jgi:glycine/D-amino acid oxidase-like deaminating enzyme/nitrite reductase/ring-hydroxylating ferredoxin subunit
VALEDRYFELERLHGKEGAWLAAQSHSAAVDQVEAIASREGIDCDFERVDGYLFVPPGESRDVLEREVEAAQRAGLSGVTLESRAPLSSFNTGPCLRFPRQAQFHPLKYLAGLARCIQDAGGRIFTQTHAAEIESGPPGSVTTDNNGATILADSIVVATNTPVNDRGGIHTKQAPYRTYVIGVRVPHESIPKGLYWETAHPYHYVRLATERERDDDILIVGGEDHKTGQADDTGNRFGRLEAWTRERFPMVSEVAYRWSGQVMQPVDGLAFIGRNPMDQPNIYIATGDSGNGMTHGTIAGMLITDLILGRDNPWANLYDPNRRTVRAAREFVRANVNVAAQYMDWAKGGEVNSAAAIPAGSGAVLRQGLKKVAVYRDEAGAIHAFSAECPHRGCVVGWNTTERTWDCPCHGSRFDSLGRVVNGPANKNLKPAETSG